MKGVKASPVKLRLLYYLSYTRSLIAFYVEDLPRGLAGRPSVEY